MATISGTTSKDILKGTATADTINGLGGNDILSGLGGNDVINGGDGNDKLYGEAAFYQGKYYLLSNFGTWQNAQNEAVSLGGNLVTINDAAENQFLANTFGNEGRIWIGLTDQVTEGVFKWISGEPVTYLNWFPGQPDDSDGNQDYAVTNFINAGQWDDTSNTTTRRGIIEILASAILAGNDTLNGEIGNDTLFGGFGNDVLDGGIGTDTADYSTLTGPITLLPTGVVNKGIAGTDQLIQIERIVGAVNQNNLIDASSATGTTVSINVNLATNSLSVNGISSPLSFTVENFVNVTGTTQADNIIGNNLANRIDGNSGNDSLSGNEGDDTFVGSIGNDTIDGGVGFDTLDYSAFTQAITFQGRGFLDKGTAGIDTIANIERVIGAVGKANSIDASNGITTTTSLIANLATNSLTVNGLPGGGTLSFTVENFVNVTGTTQADTIIGNSLANKIDGRSGDDSVIGSAGDDTLDGGVGFDTLDYSGFTQAITFQGRGFLSKGTAGIDTIANFEKVIGAVGQANSIDASNGVTTTTSLIANLATNSLTVNGLPGGGTLSFTVENFVNVTGTTQADTIIGNSLANKIDGRSGDDSLLGNEGDDTFVGSTGNDTIDGGVGIDTLDYSAFSEAITFQGRGFVDKGEAGIERIVNIERVIGAVGQANSIDASNGITTTTSLVANLATNSLIVNGLPTPPGSLSFTVENFVNIVGTTQADSLIGNNLANEISGSGGNDTIAGNDGDDNLFGGLGADSIQGDNGNDLLVGDADNDTLRGNAGDDILDGGAGRDSLFGGSNNDLLLGDLDNDSLVGELGNDTLSGDDGNDTLNGGDGIDQLEGGTGADLLLGGNANDSLFGNSGVDILRGEAGNDFLFGGEGNDSLQGGANNDTFVLALNNGNDSILDFQDGFDKLGLGGGLTFAQLTIVGTSTATLIQQGSNILATVQNVSSSLITSADFITVVI